MPDDLLDLLNPQQRAAVTAGTGPVLVLAGPGSGKTRVLTHRIAYLVRDMGVPSDALLAVTFTNKAAGEMRGRVAELLGGKLRGLQIGTFHAICARLLRREGVNTPFGPDYVIYDTDDQVSAVTQALNELNVDTKKFNPRRVLGAISTAKNELIPPTDYQALDYFAEIVARAYARYQAILLDNNALDFDDLLMQMAVLLRENDAIREKYQRFFEFVLVDEFQDTNTAQYELVRLLAQPRNNVFVVGDEDQGIYAFRGADYRNVLRFKQDYPSAEVILLEQNYRSTQVVLDAARAVIDKNANRTPKKLFTDREGGAPVTVYEAYNEEFEARYVLEQIEEIMRHEKRPYGDFAVMYRTNAQSRALEQACIREGIPYTLIGGVGFYKRREVRDLLAYLRIIHNSSDKIGFARIINVPRRGIGQKSLAEFQAWAAHDCDGYDDALNRLISGQPTGISGRAARLFADFGVQVQRWREMAASGNLIELLDTVMADIGYNLYLVEMSDSVEQQRDREDNVQELRGLASTATDEGMSLGEFLAEQSLVSDVDALAVGEDAVTLLTLHAAKGLEYPIVFITGLEEGLMPHARSFDDPDGMSEERRLMYVGVTRAKDRLYLTYAFRRAMYGSSNANAPSRFLGDVPQEIVEGLNPRLNNEHSQRRFQEQTRWDSPSFSPRSSESRWPSSRLSQDLAREREQNNGGRDPNNTMRSKIVPFPGSGGSSNRPDTQFRSGMKVTHPRFGEGTVIESKADGDDEEVTVAFIDRRVGIKTVLASFGLKLED